MNAPGAGVGPPAGRTETADRERGSDRRLMTNALAGRDAQVFGPGFYRDRAEGEAVVERIRILDARTVVTTMERHPPEALHPWGATAYISRAQQAYMMRRVEQLAGLDSQSRAAIYHRDDAAHIPRYDSHRIEVQMIGDQPFNDAMRDHPELLHVSVRDIPGYRLVYDFPGLAVRAERLWPVLDQLAQAGVHEIQLDHLRGLI